ncbi:UNVERIFIED_CONTAM: hypothetical protein RMT77_013923 [Armadillidium vulgare]
MVDNIQWIWNNSITHGIFNSPTKALEFVFPKKTCYKTISKVAEAPPLKMIMIPSYSRWFIRFAGLSGALAVALGAYGAHVFYQREYPEELKQVYETANRYHFLHTLALLGVPLCRRPKIAGPLLALGTLVFSGTCYYYALTGSRSVRQFTPYGGMMLIFGWLAMIL